MINPYELLKNILIDIETHIREYKDAWHPMDASVLSEKYSLSEGYMRRLFNFAFNQPISGYIRSRRLALSLDDLLKTDANVLDISLDYGFDYEQSYIRAFKREFGITPGDFRKTGQIVKVKPPIHLFDENKPVDGVLFGPEIVMIPEFHVIGKQQPIPFNHPVDMPPQAAKQFWHNERKQIKNVINHDVYIGLTHSINQETKSTEYLPSVQVKSLESIPPGLDGYTFDTSLCARFRYIGQHHYYDIDAGIASAMYDAIRAFAANEHTGYTLLNDKVYFERIDTRLYDGTYCQMEWFTPAKEKK